MKKKASTKQAPASPQAAPPAEAVSVSVFLTKPLGLLGWEKLEPVLLAALATCEPLLLIGKHGTAKSFLLERLAQALGLTYRFYNASLVNYDDLVGIPVPDAQQTSLRYISTPTAIWDAEVVFIDELNRTRPDLQNKLFSIIHEKRVQGVDLDKLRYRWAAMNPPPTDDQEPGDVYLGAEPLDPALADRFGFLIEVPDWCDLSEAEKRELLTDQFRGRHEFPVNVADLVARTAATYTLFCARPPDLCGYFVALESQLRGSGTRLSSRRLSMLFRTALGIHAARMTLARKTGEALVAPDWETTLFLAIAHGHPGLASGPIDRGTLTRYKEVVRRFEAFLGPERCTQELCRLDVADFAAFRDELAKTVTAGTANLCIKIMSGAMKAAWREGLIGDNPAAKIERLKPRRKDVDRRRPFTLGELRTLLAHANPEWKGIILCGIYTGQRLGDIVRLIWRNVDLERGEIHFETQKTGRVVALPMAKPLLNYLLTLPSADDAKAPVFPEAFGVVTKEGRVNNLSNAFYDLLVKAELADERSSAKQREGDGRAVRRQQNELVFHSLRHTATSLLKNAGVSDAVVMDIIGHDSKAVSRNYTHIDDDAKRRAFAVMPDIMKDQAAPKGKATKGGKG